MTFEKWWNDYDNLQCDKDACEDAFYAGQQTKQGEVDKLNRELLLMNGWEKIAHTNGEDKRLYISENDKLKEALNYMLEQLDHPYRTCGERVEVKVNSILNKGVNYEN